MAEAAVRVDPLRGLTFKQAAATLMVAVALGLIVGAIELYADWSAMREGVQQRMQRTLALVQGSAVEAAYQLHPELSRQLVNGLSRHQAVSEVVLTDNFGNVLARAKGNPQGAPAGAGRLFAGVTDYQLPLTYKGSGGDPEPVGRLEVTLSAGAIAGRFLDRALLDVGLGLLRAIAISALVAVVFYLMIIRPLVRVTGAIARVDPGQPGSWPAPRLRGHQADELGLLTRSLDELLTAFQQGLDQRNRAEADLRELTGVLEQRVADRTADLKRKQEETEQALARLEQTHGELEKANRQVMESIHYARRIQTATLPDTGALGDAVDDIAVLWEPLQAVGGDWYWLERRGGRCLIAVADCTGHGVPGAFMTLVVASALDGILRQGTSLSPATILAELDRSVRARLRQDRDEADSDDGLDAAICLWDAGARTLTFAGANLPLLYYQDGEVHTVRGNRASLGYHSLPPREPFVEHEVPIEQGTGFYLLTDGATDQMGGDPPRLLGRRRLAARIAEHGHRPMAAQLTHIQQALADYRGDEHRRDDMTIVGFQPS